MENININITSTEIEGKEAGQIIFEGDLSIQNAQLIKDKILDALETYENLKVVVQNMSDMDLSVFQILYAFKKSSEKNNKLTLFEFNIPETTKSIIKNSGIYELFQVYNN